MNNYLLATTTQAAQNLDMQHDMMAAVAFEQLAKAGLQKGMVVWDMGCGSGAMTEYLARYVGPGGHVYALDLSPDQVHRTRERLQQAGFNNVTCLQGDLEVALDLPKESADLVYARMVLMHLKNPEIALATMGNLLRVGGLLSLQESIMDTASTSPRYEVVHEYFQTLIALGDAYHRDFNIGNKLTHLCEKLGGFEIVDSYLTERKLDAVMAKHILLARLPEWEEKALDSKLLTPQKLQYWKQVLESLQGEEFSFVPAMQGHLVARKCTNNGPFKKI